MIVCGCDRVLSIWRSHVTDGHHGHTLLTVITVTRYWRSSRSHVTDGNHGHTLLTVIAVVISLTWIYALLLLINHFLLFWKEVLTATFSFHGMYKSFPGSPAFDAAVHPTFVVLQAIKVGGGGGGVNLGTKLWQETSSSIKVPCNPLSRETVVASIQITML